MRHHHRFVALYLLALIGCERGWSQQTVHGYISAHERPLQALAEEWLRDGVQHLAHGGGNAPPMLRQVNDLYTVIPLGRDIPDLTWMWQGPDSAWLIQSHHNIRVAADGAVTYLPPIRVMTFDEAARYSTVAAERLRHWMDAMKQLGIASLSREGEPSSVRITFSGSGLSGVYFTATGRAPEKIDRHVLQIDHLWGPWYYFREGRGL
jgi:hypothetical protein